MDICAQSQTQSCDEQEKKIFTMYDVETAFQDANYDNYCTDDPLSHLHYCPKYLDVKTLFGEEEIKYNEKDFPDKVTEVYEYEVGLNDTSDWIIVGQIVNENNIICYFKYCAWCDFTGFDCQGGMTLYLSTNLDKIRYYA